MKLTVRPLTDRSFIGATPRTASKFSASWGATLELLEREVYTLQTPAMPDPICARTASCGPTSGCPAVLSRLPSSPRVVRSCSAPTATTGRPSSTR